MAVRFMSVAALTAVLAPAIGNGMSWGQITAGCTANSFTTPSWLVQDFTSQIAANLTVASFHTLNRATNVTTELRCTSTTPTAGWQSCRARNQTEQPFHASFQADTSTAWFLFNETWPCNDLTPSQTYVLWDLLWVAYVANPQMLQTHLLGPRKQLSRPKLHNR